MESEIDSSNNGEWRDQVACRPEDVDLFLIDDLNADIRQLAQIRRDHTSEPKPIEYYERKKKSENKEAIKFLAQMICIQCEVNVDCLQYSLENFDSKAKTSIWAGYDRDSRKIMRNTYVRKSRADKDVFLKEKIKDLGEIEFKL